MQSSTQLFYFKQWKYNIVTNPIPLQFFAVTYSDGIYFWEYEEISEKYNHFQMISNAQSRFHKRGEMNEEGIYVSVGLGCANVKI